MRRELLGFLESAKASHAGNEYEGDDTKPVEKWHPLGKAKRR
jgi:hypothetical protein